MKTCLLLLAAVLLPLTLYAGQGNSGTYKASQIISATPTQLNRIDIHNAGGSDQYYIICNSATLPANGTVTALVPPIKVIAGATVSYLFPRGLQASTGIVVANSSTDKSGTNVTLTIGSADSFFWWDTQ